nr:hypothetical protein [Ardenticatenales bacterium]
GTPRGSLTVPRLKVSPPPPTGTLAVPQAEPFGEVLTLLSHDALPTALTASETLTLRTHWRADQSMERPLTSFLHLVGPNGALVAQSDLAPPYPVTLWSHGEIVEIAHTLALPATLPPGPYTFYLGWYDSASLERVPVPSNEPNVLPLGQIDLP